MRRWQRAGWRAWDRQEHVFPGASDPHPFDTVRRDTGGRLDFRPLRGLEVHLSTRRLRRTGDAALDQHYRDDRSLPVAATIDFHGLGFDAATGPIRFGGTWAWSRAGDDSVRTLDRPDTPQPDLGTYRNLSDVETGTATARAGVHLLDGRVDLGVVSTYSSSETSSVVQGSEVSVGTGPDGRQGTPDDVAWSTETRGRTESDSRGRTWRADLLVLPHPDAEVLVRVERRRADARGDADLRLRVQSPPYSDPSQAFGPVPQETSAKERLAREGIEARWRITPEWRLRGGAERVDERVAVRDRDTDLWTPRTTAGTAGFDFTPSERFDASVLGRVSRTADAPTSLSAEEGRGLSVRLRARRPDGWHATGFARVKQKSNGDSDAFTTYDSYGMVFGRGHDGGFFEASLTREDFTLASDTRFAVDLGVTPVKTPHRVRYDEAATSAALDFSQALSGPLRAFGSGHWTDAHGDLPFVRYDAALGLGWRFVPSTELRLEVRRISFDENGAFRDDYRSRIVTLSVRWEF